MVKSEPLSGDSLLLIFVVQLLMASDDSRLSESPDSYDSIGIPSNDAGFKILMSISSRSFRSPGGQP
jgi:hypothetical protein